MSLFSIVNRLDAQSIYPLGNSGIRTDSTYYVDSIDALVGFGVQAGVILVPHHRISTDGSTDERKDFSWLLGGYLELIPWRPLRFAAELNYVRTGARIESVMSDSSILSRDTELNYASILINAKIGFHPVRRVFIFAVGGWRLDAKINYYENGLNGLYKDIKGLDFGPLAGVGFSVRTPNFEIGLQARYIWGLNSYPVSRYTISNETKYFQSGTTFKNESIQVIFTMGTNKLKKRK